MAQFAPLPLPDGITSNFIATDGLNTHILEAGPREGPLVLLLHGFPELAYSWRKIILPLAASGFHVVAPDLRGYGRTTSVAIGGDPASARVVAYDDDLAPFRPLARVKDVVTLLVALRVPHAFAVVGHDAGSPLAGNCALVRPDLFHRVVCMSAPYTGPPGFVVQPAHSAVGDKGSGAGEVARGAVRPPSIFPAVSRALEALNPPRKHYTVYYSTREANDDMTYATSADGDAARHAKLRELWRAYYYVKSADWAPNAPHALSVPSAAAAAAGGAGDPVAVVTAVAAALAQELPEYYVMRADRTMGESVLPFAGEPGTPAHAAVVSAQSRWLPEDELAVYVGEYARTGFQGGLNGYRCVTDASGRWGEDMLAHADRKVVVPAMFIAGAKDWNVYQYPGAVEIMEKVFEAHSDGWFVRVDGAGHWVQQEQPGAVMDLLLKFFGKS